MDALAAYSKVQGKAKDVLARLGPTITPLDTEHSISERAIRLLQERGIIETWYYDCPAFVLLGSRSSMSASGRDYIPASEHVGLHNLVTVDLSPLHDGIWGDCARSFVIEQGKWTQTPKTGEFLLGLQAEAHLHWAMRSFVEPTTTVDALYHFGNAEIQRLGFENLDFMGNLGHSIAMRREDRSYIAPGDHTPLSKLSFFTFEPHIRQYNGAWGFKHEEIYYFGNNGKLRLL
ncbi:hypothetical protein GCM10007205_27640 [Oxalicibacterium flavum]|uniref:Peptidase M24 domain-containing protein n=2 Tax=Oxalicibacterium flavum TaxID=179467 RepID=A0A8J2XYY9_9BURK|nr:hypothetical protein GCM10007205_27640 [Oxalicibacterium flavum]